jgi:hypothetical protein
MIDNEMHKKKVHLAWMGILITLVLLTKSSKGLSSFFLKKSRNFFFIGASKIKLRI